MPSRMRGLSSSHHNLSTYNFPHIQANGHPLNLGIPVSPSPSSGTPGTPFTPLVNPYASSHAIAINATNQNSAQNDGSGSGSGSSGGNYAPTGGGSMGSGAITTHNSFGGSFYLYPQNSSGFGGYGSTAPNNFNNSGGHAPRARGMSTYHPPPLKRAQSVMHRNNFPVANSFVRHNIDPKWDMKNDDCFGDDLSELVARQNTDDDDESSPSVQKGRKQLVAASAFSKSSPRLLMGNGSRDRSMSVDLSSSMFDKVGDVLRERAIVIQQKMNRDLKTFLWELKDVENRSIEMGQIETIAHDILDSKTIDDLGKRDFMKELQAILQTCITNYTGFAHRTNSPSIQHFLSTTPTTPTAIPTNGLLDSKYISEQFETMRQIKKLIFIFSRVNRVLELYKKHLMEEKKNKESLRDLAKKQRQRFKSIAVVGNDSFPQLDINIGELIANPEKPTTPVYLKPTIEEHSDDVSTTSVSPRRESVSSSNNNLPESSDYDSAVSSPRSSMSNSGTPTTNSNSRDVFSQTSTPVTPGGSEKKKSESFFSKFTKLFTSKREDDHILLPLSPIEKKPKSLTSTPLDSKKKSKKDNDTGIEILCRICEELVPSEKLAEHSSTCAVKHKVEMQNVTVFEKLKNIRKAIEKTVKKKKSSSLHKLYKIAKRAEQSKDRSELQELIGSLANIIEEHKEDNFSGNNYRVSVYAKRLTDVIENKCTALLQEEKQLMGRPLKPKIKISDFEILKPISRGAYGRVYLTRKKSTNDIYAIKVIKKQYLYNHKNVGKTLTNQQDLVAERTIMKMLMDNNEQSPFIVNFYYSFAGKRYLYIVMEYCPGGSLDCLLADKLENGEAFDIDTVRHIAAETILALSDLHSNNIVHRDLKPDNMLIDKVGHLKLTDFGLSEIGIMDREDEQTSSHKQSFDRLRQDEDESAINVRGTPDYLAPELLLGMPHNEEVDYWSLGCIVFELLFGCPPFNDDTPEYIFDNILSRRINWVDERLLPPEIVSCGVLDFIDKLLDPNPETRLNDRTAKEHPFMKGVNWDKVLKEPLGVLPNVKDLTDTSKFKARDELYPMHEKRDSGDGKGSSTLSDIDDSSESFTEQTEMTGSMFELQTPPTIMSNSMRDLRAAGRPSVSQRSSSFHSTTSSSPAAGSITHTDSSFASPSHMMLSSSVVDSFSFPEAVNTAALSRLNDELIRQHQVPKL